MQIIIKYGSVECCHTVYPMVITYWSKLVNIKRINLALIILFTKTIQMVLKILEKVEISAAIFSAFFNLAMLPWCDQCNFSGVIPNTPSYFLLVLQFVGNGLYFLIKWLLYNTILKCCKIIYLVWFFYIYYIYLLWSFVTCFKFIYIWAVYK